MKINWLVVDPTYHIASEHTFWLMASISALLRGNCYVIRA